MNALVAAEAAEGVLTVTLQRPEKRNALSLGLIAAIRETFGAWRGREDVVVAVLTGAGDKAFASGGDVHESAALRTEAEALDFAQTTCAALDAIRQFPVPVIAALNGDALGGGAELALACDVRIAAPHARIGFLQATLDIPSAWGGGTDLFRFLGPARAMMLLAAAEALPADRALAAGLIDAIGAGPALDAFVAPFASRKRQVARAFKAMAIAHREGRSGLDSRAVEARHFAEAWVHEDHWRAVDRRFGRSGGQS